jgi:hypothetical protein
MTGIAKAHEIAELCKESMVDFEVMMCASEIVNNASTLSQDELINLMFKYSGILTAKVATHLTHALMSESDFDAMCEDVKMFDEIGKEVLGE